MRTRTTPRLGAAAALAAVLMTPMASADALSAAHDPLVPFASQRLMWTECAGLDAPDCQCAAVKVPLDYARPTPVVREAFPGKKPFSAAE